MNKNACENDRVLFGILLADIEEMIIRIVLMEFGGAPCRLAP